MATTITEDAYTDDAWRLSVKRVTKKRKLQNYVLLFRFFHCFVWRFENFEHAFTLVYLCTACLFYTLIFTSCVHLLGNARIVGLCGADSLHLSGVRASVRPSVCPSVGHSSKVCCCDEQQGSLWWANAGSVTLSACVVAEHRLIVFVTLC